MYQHFAHIPSLGAIGKPSIVDGNLDGTYCARCNKNVAVKGLKFKKNVINIGIHAKVEKWPSFGKQN